MVAMGRESVIPAPPPHSSETGCVKTPLGYENDAATRIVIPAKAAVSKRHPSEAHAPEIVIPAKAGIQAGWSGETPRSTLHHHPWIPAFAGMTEGRE